MAQQTVIAIGHGAYRGVNALRLCFSKAQAIRVLRMRGMTRDGARKAVNEVCTKPSGYKTVTVDKGVVEICNEAYRIEQGYFSDIDSQKTYWDKQPEL